MRRILSILLILALLPVSALAADDPKALPAVGDVVEGFKVVDSRDFPLIGGTAVLFEHERTGALLMYLANEDTDRAFDLTFRTQPIDNTGLPHVFEHSTLDGSEKYPSKALFFNLSSQTYNTFMNAMTLPTMTTYPVASLSEAQLLKYADYYTDSCLNPVIMDDESIFREEAWRYRLPDMDGELTIEGTVYSEMLGAITLERAANINLMGTAFPGSVAANDHGGLPEDIPSMTFESLCAYHDLYYHPSNLIAYLYGDFEDYAAFLRLLDRAFEPFERRDFTFEDAGYTPLTESVEAEYGFPVEAGSDTANASAVHYAYVCPGLNRDREAERTVNLLMNLFSSSASRLMQNLEKALPKATFSVGFDMTGPEDLVLFVAENVDREDAALFKQTVDESIAQTLEEGFPQDIVDGITASIELSTALLMENSGVGVNMIESVAYEYVNSGDPYCYMDYVEGLDTIDELNAQGAYREAIAAWLAPDQITALAVTYPVPGLKEENDAALRERLAQVKADMTEEELQAIIDRSNATEAEPDDAAKYISELQAVTVESLPEEVREYALSDETGEDGVRRLNVEAAVDGIGRTDVWLDGAGFTEEELLWLHLFTSVLGEMDTDAHTRDELDALVERYFYDTVLRMSILGRDETCHVCLRLGWIAREEDLEAGYDLMYELLYGTDLTDVERLKELVGEERASLKSSFKSMPYSIGLYRGLARYDRGSLISDHYNYLDYYEFLGEAERMLEEEPERVVEKLEHIQASLNNRANAVTAYAGTKEGIALNRTLADAFLAKLGEAPVEAVELDLPVPADSEGIIIDSNAQYNGHVIDLESCGFEEYDAALNVVTTAVYDAYLIPQLRDRYGAYGVLHAATEDSLYLLSYRDPNVAETFAVYEGLGDFMRGLEMDQDTLDGYILSAYVGYAMPTGVLSGALDAIVDALTEEDPDSTLENMRALKALKVEDLGRYADMYDALVENGYKVTVGGASVINENGELYDAVLDPLGAKDAGPAVMEDVQDDDPSATAVHFAVGSGFMLPLSDTEFGVHEPATVGDLAGALYCMTGGDPEDQDNALQALQGYGLFPQDLTVGDPLTDEAADGLLSDFSQAVGLSYERDHELTGEPLTRGELAGVIMVFVEMLDTDE